MANFIINTTNQYINKSKQVQSASTEISPSSNDTSLSTTMGIPYNRSSKKVCKLYNEAYNKIKKCKYVLISLHL